MGWQDDLPEGLRDAPFIGKAATLEEAVSQIKDAAGYMGNSIRIPGPDATEEDVAKFRARAVEKYPGLIDAPDTENDESITAFLRSIGAPDDAAKYEPPADAVLSEVQLANLKATAGKGNLTQRQFETLASEFAGIDSRAVEDAREAFDGDIATLKVEWGNAYDQKVADAKQAAIDTGAPPEIAQAIADGTLPAQSLKWLAAVNDQLGGEAGDMGAQGKGEREAVMTPDEAMAQLAEVETKLFTQNTSPEEKARLTKKRNALMLHAYPQASTNTKQMQAGLT